MNEGEYLFFKEPEQWGLRGDVYLWRDLGELFSEGELPKTVDQFESLLRERIRKQLDEGTPWHGNVYMERYAHGGMSSGMVCLDWWEKELVPLLKERYLNLGTDSEK